MEKKLNPNPNPNSHKRLRRHASNLWSDLSSDIMISVFERLSFANFKRAKSVCSSWHSASRRSVLRNSQIPWLILFPEGNNNACTLFNPEEKDKLYKTQDLGVVFAKSVCRATFGSWLLMQDPRYNLYMVNIFTKDRINLPPMESQLGSIKIERTKDDELRIISNKGYGYESKRFNIPSFVLWIDVKTKDFIVLWGLGEFCVVYSKKGDTSWSQIPKSSDCYQMVYKDHKLYSSRYYGYSFKIFDFSADTPREAFHDDTYHTRYRRLRGGAKFVVTVSGDVLRVERMFSESGILSFIIYKVYSSLGFLKDHEEVDSLGDEAMLLDLGITVLASDIEGIKPNCIYFTGYRGRNTTDISLYNIETQKMELLRKFDCSSAQFSRARWFLPSFVGT
ncbi:unnamed protein product [Microthlaspi erraticum]|uniref:F-box domain-containing protein n=1 Tax=Microthlaspi erraticum TaxID=1685480 RepID=A0A6D2IL67_9BRAS|nr:unnamed protein product [Microthlaspi erraticum]